MEAMWSSIFAIVDRLLYLEIAIMLHEEVHKIVAFISETDGAILCLLKPVMETFMIAQKLLDGNT